ncbi:MAG: hypothetical protein ACK573_16510 [Pseudanabaena sp.]
MVKVDRCLMREIGDRVLWVEGRSLFDWGKRRSDLWVMKGRSLFGFEI